MKTLNSSKVKSLINDGFDVDLPLTITGMSLWSLVMCTSNAMDTEGSSQKQYISMCKVVKKKRPDLLATDKAGRSCFHFAASAGNFMGLQFIVELLAYLDRKEAPKKNREGTYPPSVTHLANGKTRGGVTPLMKAVEASC